MSPNLTGDKGKCYQQQFQIMFLAIFDKTAIATSNNGLLVHNTKLSCLE
jgi:hypothetical protein